MSFPAPTPGPSHHVEQPTERVGLGLLLALGAVVGGMVVTVVLAQIGVIAAISSFVVAFGAAFLYQAGAGRSARKGLAPLLVLIVVGVVLCYFSLIASNLWDAYSEIGITEISRVGFVREFLFSPGDVFEEPHRDLLFFAIFGVLGVFGVVRQLFANR